MPRLRQVHTTDAHELAQTLYGMLFGDRDPVDEPGTATGSPGDWWTVTALVPDLFDHIVGGFGFYRSGNRLLDPQLRELGQTRTGWARGSRFVYSQHVKACREVGLPEEKIQAIRPEDCNEIILNMKDQGSKVRFEIEDRGQGIPADQRERVFERFFRIQNNNTSLKEGTGLGLSIVKNLVNLMGGSVGNEKAYPEGTIFWFTLNKKN